jgi:hypothetical protein
MPDFPLPVRLTNRISIATSSPEALGDNFPLGAAFAVSNAWPTSNLAIYIPVEIYEPVTIVKMSVNNGSAVSGNIDVGIYDAGGKRLVSKGSTAQAGTSAIQTFDITDTLLLPGLYYMAVALDNTTGTLAGWNSMTSPEQKMVGLYEQGTAFPLPATATFATFTQTAQLPLVSMSQKVTI